MIVALSGTPGTGKSTVTRILAERGLRVLEVGALAEEKGAVCGRDEDRGSLEIDVDALDEALRKEREEGTTLLVGHLSHLLTADLIIVLRTSPAVLLDRLRGRGWPERKVRENVEAEACDVILVEALERTDKVFEIDTSHRTPDETADAVLEILAGKTEKYAHGNIDWSEEVLSWF